MSQRVLITGSSKGIGRATAAHFASKGDRVVINGRNAQALERAREELASSGAVVEAVVGDVADPESADAMVAEAVNRLGGLDVLINNAGIAMRGRFDQTSPEVWRRVMDTNVLGCAYVTRAALPHIRSARGSILFVSSLVAIWGFPMVAAYSAGKMALDGMVESLRTEMTGSGVHLGIVYVGITQNDQDKTILSADGADMSLAERTSAMPQSKVAAAIYRAVRRRRSATVLTVSGRALAALARFAPWVIRLGLRVSANRIAKLSK